MNTAGELFFTVCLLAALLGGLGVVLARDPIRSAVSLLASILGVAGLYLKLHAEFLAAIQVIVYAGAVVVLFVFVIMLLGADAGGRVERGSAHVARAAGAALIGAFALAGLVLLMPAEYSETVFTPAPVGFGTVEAVGRQIFTQALVPFELSTALLIVAVVGAIAVSRGRGGAPRPRPPIENPTRRLFGGPIHPRDGARPAADPEEDS
jgi:NADH-quinone oxidoreductase subunit J